MLDLVTGQSGSGKSAYAEKLAAESSHRWYIATMRVFGEEERRRVEKHRAMRAGKGFVTLECTGGLENIVLPRPDSGSRTAVLLEDLSNLAANEYFDRKEGAPERILSGIEAVARQTDHLIIVTNEVFSDGTAYPEETMQYLNLLGILNRVLAGRADRVTEVVCGIPVILKDTNGRRKGV